MNSVEAYYRINDILLKDAVPSTGLYNILKSSCIYPITLISEMAEVPQEAKYHPEGDVLSHTMLVVDEAAKRRHLSKDEEVLMWSALLHDLGKKATTKRRKGRWTSYDHDKVGEKKVNEFFESLGEAVISNELCHKVSKITRWHMQTLFITKGLPFADIGGLYKEVDVQELGLLSLCDRLGRGNMDRKLRQEVVEEINEFLTIVGRANGVRYKKFTHEGMSYN